MIWFPSLTYTKLPRVLTTCLLCTQTYQNAPNFTYNFLPCLFIHTYPCFWDIYCDLLVYTLLAQYTQNYNQLSFSKSKHQPITRQHLQKPLLLGGAILLLLHRQLFSVCHGRCGTVVRAACLHPSQLPCLCIFATILRLDKCISAPD